MERIAQQYRSGKRDNNGNRMASSAISEKGHIQINQARTPGQMPVYRGETINLSNLPQNPIKPCKDLDDVNIRRNNSNRHSKILLVDVCAGPSTNSFPDNTNAKDITVLSLPLPSTLVKRSNYPFENLLKNYLGSDEKYVEFTKIIKEYDVFIFSDSFSKISSCLKTTFCLIEKFKKFICHFFPSPYLEFFLFEGSLNDSKASSIEKNKKNCIMPKLDLNLDANLTSRSTLNLRINIPPPNDSNKIFLQSLKKDLIHYSPNSLQKFFQFNIPADLASNDTILPNWLKFCSIKENEKVILKKLFDNFEILENFEMQRLEKCLKFKKMSSLHQKQQSQQQRVSQSTDNSKLYSLTSLQRQYKTSVKGKVQNNQKLKLTIPKNNTSSSPSPLSSDDTIMTPINDYELTEGIQSFTKNRYSNILPYEHSRVKLPHSPKLPAASEASTAETKTDRPYPVCPLDTKNHSCKINDYINANYLKLSQINPDFKYIATQAPLPSTMDDFWKVITLNHVKIIISLNSDDELNLRKWDIYWNNSSYSNHTIKLQNTWEDICNINGCVLRVFQVTKIAPKNDSIKQDCGSSHTGDLISTTMTTSKPFIVYQLQYKNWLDSCGVDINDIIKVHKIKNSLLFNPQSFIASLKKDVCKPDLVDDKNSDLHLDTANSSPLLVHCSAGCGRTGVFVTLDFLLSILSSTTNHSNKIDVWNMTQDLIFIIVNELRKQRISMVQNLTQYIACYEALLNYFALQKQIKNEFPC
ncbi:tyrosine protein phosphatase PTP2 [Saccharomyces paradoxus]|uniref:Tyrosine protein phosphatase PTP2 n=1 Tax=Saccharomyces paradoxus TaxID=27291 RepID=A0A8B8UZZ4_SACPA|nr:Ptp2 [Saccharomyces paradoxus]QHS76303.1 Ptp2 [Saccharomyces paradoxus]